AHAIQEPPGAAADLEQRARAAATDEHRPELPSLPPQRAAEFEQVAELLARGVHRAVPKAGGILRARAAMRVVGGIGLDEIRRQRFWIEPQQAARGLGAAQ